MVFSLTADRRVVKACLCVRMAIHSRVAKVSQVYAVKVDLVRLQRPDGSRVGDSSAVTEGKCLTVLAGRALLASDEDYRIVSFIMEDMYGDTRADIRRSSEFSQAPHSRLKATPYRGDRARSGRASSRGRRRREATPFIIWLVEGFWGQYQRRRNGCSSTRNVGQLFPARLKTPRELIYGNRQGSEGQAR